MVSRLLVPKNKVEEKPKKKRRKTKKSPIGHDCYACHKEIKEHDMAGTMNFADPKTGKLDARHCHLVCMQRVLEVAKQQRVNWYGKDHGPAGAERNKEKKMETANEYMLRMAANANRKITFTKHD